MVSYHRFLPERDPDYWYPPDGIADSLRPIAMYAQAAPHGLEVILFGSDGEPLGADIRRAWSDRRARRITPVLVIVFHPTLNGERVSLCGPTDAKMYHAVEVSRAERLAEAALDKSSHHAATRFLEKELPELGTPIAGLRNVGLLTAEMIEAIPTMPEWEAAVMRAVPLLMSRGSTLVERLGYSVNPLGANTRMLSLENCNLAVGVFCNENEPFDEQAIRFGSLTPTLFALTVAKEQRKQQIDWALLTRGSEIRLCSTSMIKDQGKEDKKKGFVELNLDILPKAQAGYLPLLFSAEALAENGALSNILDTTTKRAEPNQEENMASNRELIGCVGGETIVLERHSEEINLSLDNKMVRLSKEAAGRLVEWLRSQIDGPDDPPLSPARGPTPGGGPYIPPRPRTTRNTPRRIEGTIWGLIQSGLLEPGTVLTLTNGRKSKVLENGSLEVDGHSFNSPSGAGRFVLHRECNGWKEWTIPDGRPLDALRQELRRRNNG